MSPIETIEPDKKRKLDPHEHDNIEIIEAVPIPSSELVFRRVLMPRIDANPPVFQTRVVLQLRKSDGKVYFPWCYDLDIGYLLKCHMVKRDQQSGIFTRWVSSAPESYILVLRKSYFARPYHITATNKKLFSYPDHIWVNGVKFKLHHCAGNDKFCYAERDLKDFRLIQLDHESVLVPASAASCPSTAAPPQLENDFPGSTAATPTHSATVLLAVEGQPYNTLGAQSARAVQEAHRGYELPRGFDHTADLVRGKLLCSVDYGEVYQGYLLKGCRGGEEAVFDHSQAQKVAIKVVRHPNDHNRSQLECVHFNTDGLSHTVEHHAIAATTSPTLAQATSSATVQATTSPMTPTPPQVRTSHLKPFFENLRVKHGLNENWMNEIEMMVLIQKSIEQLEAASEFCDARATAAALRRRFLPLGGVGLCSNNLFIVTKYLPFGSVFDYVSKYGRLDERCCKHVIFQVLHCVNFLHERGIADQDLSLENLLLQAPTEAKQELLDQCGKKLSQADFLQMEVVMIDRGQASVHGKCETDSCCSSGGSTKSRRTEDSADTTTTCESSSGRSDLSSSGCVNCASPVPQHRLGGANPSDTTSPHAHNSFLLLKMISKICVGKPSYHCPELHLKAESARTKYAKLLAQAAAKTGTVPAAVSPEISDVVKKGGMVPMEDSTAGPEGREDLEQEPQQAQQAPTTLEGQEDIVVSVPEKEYYCGFSVDMWHIGIMLIYLFTGRAPFEMHNLNTANALRFEVTWYEDLAEGNLAARPVMWEGQASTLGAKLPADCFDLLKQLLRFDPDQRISAEQALQHRWFHGLNIT